MTVLAIDTGPTQSAWLLWNGTQIVGMGIDPNDQVLTGVLPLHHAEHLAIEMVESFGMPVGKEVFETVYWIGRFVQAWNRPTTRISRMQAKMHLCHSARAKDSNIRQALVDLLGPQGTKSAPGATYGVKKDLWSALAVAVTWQATTKQKE